MKSLQIVLLISMILQGKAFFASVGLNRFSSSLKMVVAAKDKYLVTLLPGDGIGPEIVAATVPILNAVAKKGGYSFNFQEADIGGIAVDNHNDPFPKVTYDKCKESDSILLGSIGGYKWDSNPRELRPESGLLKMRKDLGLFANLRPAKVIPQLIESSTLKPEVLAGVDIMVVRELTGGIYFGTPKGIEVLENGVRRGYSTAAYTEDEIIRITKVAASIAEKRNGRICSVDKSNVLDVSLLWREVVTKTITDQFPKLKLEHMYIDNCAMQLIRNPRQFDTIVCGNMFGDILSDEASMLVGSLGMLPSASLGEASGPGVFEPCHGSAPDIAGMDKANPLAQILSAAMMLKYDLNRPEGAELIEKAVERVLDKGFRTGDIMQEGDKFTLIGCKRMGEEVEKAISEI